MYSVFDTRYNSNQSNDPFQLEGSKVDFEVESFNTPHFGGKMRTVCRVVPGVMDDDDPSQFQGLGVVTKKHPVAARTGRYKPHVDYFRQGNDAIAERFVQLGYSNALDDMDIKYSVAHNGAFAMQDVKYNNIKSDIVSLKRDGSLFETSFFLRSIMFRGIDGSCAMNCLFGEIDGFCLNGMMAGTGNWIKHKNTSVDAEGRFIFKIGDTVLDFVHRTERYKELAGRSITYSQAENVIDCLPKVSDKLKKKIKDQYHDEAIVRGDNVISLLSAFTNYSSHSNGTFDLRETGGDHEAVTMLTREFEVSKWTQTPEYQRLAA